MSDAARDGPEGLGGWLILPLVGWVITLGLTGANILSAVTDPDVLAILREPPLALPEGLRPAMLASLFVAQLLMVSCVVCLVAFFRRSRRMVAIATVHFLLLLAAGFIEFGAARESGARRGARHRRGGDLDSLFPPLAPGAEHLHAVATLTSALASRRNSRRRRVTGSQS